MRQRPVPCLTHACAGALAGGAVATSTYFIAFDIGIAIGSLLGGMVAGALGYTAMYFTVAAFPLIAGILSALKVKG